MPKEVVYGEKLHTEPSIITGKTIEEPIAEVRWSKETGDVQIVTRLQGYEMAGPDEPLTYAYGMHVTLNRHGINQLIRHLRRARDQAFGRDE